MVEQKHPPLYLHSGGERSRRTIADVMEVLRKKPGYSEGVGVVIRTTDFSGLMGIGTGVIVICEQLGWAVPLPSCTHFRALRENSDTEERFQVSRLDGARVNADSEVTLSDGTKLRAVQVMPTPQPRPFTKNKMSIVHAAVRFARAEERCYGSPSPSLMPNAKYLNFGAVVGLEIFGLKDFIKFAIEECNIPEKSRQTYSNTLMECGISVRRRGRTFLATFLSNSH